jgi:hypothetical protein
MATASRSILYRGSKLQLYGWRTFCIEFLYGLFVILWYVLYLAEKITLLGVTRLDSFTTYADGAPDGYQRESSALLQDRQF